MESAHSLKRKHHADDVDDAPDRSEPAGKRQRLAAADDSELVAAALSCVLRSGLLGNPFPLARCCKALHDDASVWELFINKSVELDGNWQRRTPLMAAAFFGNFPRLTWLLQECKAEPNRADRAKNAALYYAIANKAEEDREDLVEILLRNGATGKNPLALCVEKKRNKSAVQVIKAFLSGPDMTPDLRKKFLSMCLLDVCKGGMGGEAALWLLREGASPEGATDFPRRLNVLQHAAENGLTDVVQAILATGFDPDALAAKADAAARGSLFAGERMTALELAASGGHLKLVEILLESGAKEKEKAAEIARSKGFTKITSLLEGRAEPCDLDVATPEPNMTDATGPQGETEAFFSLLKGLSVGSKESAVAFSAWLESADALAGDCGRLFPALKASVMFSHDLFEKILNVLFSRSARLPSDFADALLAKYLSTATQKADKGVINKLLGLGADMSADSCCLLEQICKMNPVPADLLEWSLSIGALGDGSNASPLLAAYKSSDDITALQLLKNGTSLEAARVLICPKDCILAAICEAGLEQTALWIIDLCLAGKVPGGTVKSVGNPLFRATKETPLLHSCCASGLDLVIEKVLSAEWGAGDPTLVDTIVNEPDSHGRTPLWHAAFWGHASTISLLVDKFGARVNDQVKPAYDPAQWGKEEESATVAALVHGQADALVALLQRGADPAVRPLKKPHRSALHRAVDNGHTEAVKRLLEFSLTKPGVLGDAGPSSPDGNGELPIVTAIRKVNVGMVRALLTLGKVSPDSLFPDGKPVVFEALQHCSTRALPEARQIVSLLLDAGCNIHARWGKDGKQILHLAAEMGREEVVLRLLSCPGVEVDSRDLTGSSALHLASQCGYLQVVKALLGAGASLEARDACGRTPFFRATESGKSEMALYLLLTAGSDPTSRDYSGTPAFFNAFVREDTEFALQLLESGASFDLNAKDARGRTALIVACELEMKEVAQRLILLGCDVAAEDSGNRTAFDASKGSVEMIPVLLWLLEKGSGDPNATITAKKAGSGNSTVCLLRWVISRAGNSTTAYALRLLQLGANANAPGVFEEALTWGDEKLAIGMLEHGVDIGDGPTSYDHLQLACNKQLTRAALLLIKKGAQVSPPLDDTSTSALSLALRFRDTVLIHTLLEKNASLHHLDSEGYSPLHTAIILGNDALLEFLFESLSARPEGSVNWELQSTGGNTLLHTAAACGQMFAIKALLAKKVNVNAVNLQGQTPIYAAASKGRSNVVEMLLAEGHAAIDHLDRDGKSCLHRCCEDLHIEEALLLLRKGANATLAVVGQHGVLVRPLDYLLRSLVSRPSHYYNHSTTVTLLEELATRGADFTVRDGVGRTLLGQLASSSAEHVSDLVPVLLRLGGDGLPVDALDNHGQTALSLACEKLLPKLVAALLEAGANPSAQNQAGLYPIQLAVRAVINYRINSAQENASTIVKLLTASGADPNARGAGTCAALCDAVNEQLGKVVAALLDCKNIDLRVYCTLSDTLRGMSPLHLAIHNSDYDMVEFLLEKGASTLEVANVPGACLDVLEYAQVLSDNLPRGMLELLEARRQEEKDEAKRKMQEEEEAQEDEEKSKGEPKEGVSGGPATEQNDEERMKQD
jgi:ankyrin repeat protein